MSKATLKEIQRFFEYLKQSKTNNEMTILITNDMCKDLQFMVENLCNYRDLLEEKIDKAIEYNKENKKFANEVENRYAEEICKNNLKILGDKENEI